VAIIASLLVVVGAVGFVAHARDGGKDLWSILATELVALIAGVFLLRGANWARWLAMVWMAFHVAISFRAPRQLIVHGAFLVVFAVCLFYPGANAYFTSRR
jgi:hypothetical protein